MNIVLDISQQFNGSTLEMKGKNMSTLQLDICPVCNTTMLPGNSVCESCGWLKIIYPSTVPDILQEQEDRRLRITQKFVKESKDKLSQIEAQGQQTQQLLNKEKEKTNVLQISLHEAEKRNVGISSELMKIKEQIAALTADASNQISGLKSIIDSLNDRLEKVKSELAKSEDSRIHTESELCKVKKMLVQAEQERDAALKNGGQDSQPSRDVKAEILLTCQGEESKLNVYAGENIYGTIADSILNYHRIIVNCNIQGSLFKIVEQNGIYRLYDLCGQTLRANGRTIGFSGIELNGEMAFVIANMQILIKLPEININDLNY